MARLLGSYDFSRSFDKAEKMEQVTPITLSDFKLSKFMSSCQILWFNFFATGNG